MYAHYLTTSLNLDEIEDTRDANGMELLLLACVTSLSSPMKKVNKN